MAEGKVAVPFGRFLGYDRGAHGELVVNQEEAVIVREIYKLFLAGLTPHGIAKELTSRGIPTPGGKVKWTGCTVKSILTNEKYKGDALLQKTYGLITEDEYRQIDTMFIEKYQPKIGTLFVDLQPEQR